MPDQTRRPRADTSGKRTKMWTGSTLTLSPKCLTFGLPPAPLWRNYHVAGCDIRLCVAHLHTITRACILACASANPRSLIPPHRKRWGILIVCQESRIRVAVRWHLLIDVFSAVALPFTFEMFRILSRT